MCNLQLPGNCATTRLWRRGWLFLYQRVLYILQSCRAFSFYATMYKQLAICFTACIMYYKVARYLVLTQLYIRGWLFFLTACMIYIIQLPDIYNMYYTAAGHLVYRWESNLAISSSPVTNNDVQFIVGRTAIVWKIKKFLAVRRVSA